MAVMTSPAFNVCLSQPLTAEYFLFEPPTFHVSTVPLAWTSRVIITCGSAQLYAVTVPVTVTGLARSTGHSWCASNGLAAARNPITYSASVLCIRMDSSGPYPLEEYQSRVRSDRGFAGRDNGAASPDLGSTRH